MKSINNFICKTDKPINIKNRCPQILMQQPDSRRKRSAVLLGNNPAAIFTDMYETTEPYIEFNKLSVLF